MEKVKVLIVDDSALVRQALTTIFSSDPQIEVIGVASDPYIAVSKIQKIVPDVITLDLEMPRMDGLTFLKKIMSQHPIPVVIISSYSDKGSLNALKALEYGAVEVVNKPVLSNTVAIEEAKISLCDVVKAASMAKIGKRTNIYQTVQPKLSADAVIAKPKSLFNNTSTDIIIAVGASTGGTEALKVFLEAMPEDSPGIVIVQHMPEKFTLSFANRLNELCKIRVKEASQGDLVTKGLALIAPGNKHMMVRRAGTNYYIDISEGPLVNRHRPSVDVLFRSVAKFAGKNAIGIIMTGMGDDGARGLLEMKEAGAKTAAQDEKSCVVFGMPKVAISLGAADKILPLEQLVNFALKP